MCKLPFDFDDVPFFGVWCGPTGLFLQLLPFAQCETQKLIAKADGKITSMLSSRGLIA